MECVRFLFLTYLSRISTKTIRRLIAKITRNEISTIVVSDIERMARADELSVTVSKENDGGVVAKNGDVATGVWCVERGKIGRNDGGRRVSGCLVVTVVGEVVGET